MEAYLFEVEGKNGKARKLLTEILEPFDGSITKFIPGPDITASVEFRLKNLGTSYLSEFPGNCAAIVLHNIQNKRDINKRIKVAEEVCKSFSYAYLYITLTDSNIADNLVSMGYVMPVEPFVNYHSGAVNYFLCKHLEPYEDPLEDDDYDDNDY